MKQLVCEMCGGKEFTKQDGFLVCEACGLKYSMEEARKIMVEGTVDVQGTVKVDNTDLVEKYLANARRAKQKEDWEETEKYYNLVEQNDPSNIEAIFYSSYGKAKRSLVESDIYKREAAFKVLQNCVSIIDDNYDYSDEKDLAIVQQISNDIINMACSEYVYNYTKNGYGVVTSDDKYRTITLFNNLGLAFTDSLDNIIQGYGEGERDKRLHLLYLALYHVEFILKNGSLADPTRMRSFVVAYHQQIHALDPTHIVKTEEQIKAENAPVKKPISGLLWKVFLVVFCFYPVLGAIFSGITFPMIDKGTVNNMNKSFPKATLIINIVWSVLLIIIIAATL